jgi:CubicO group peptidase (beta-lactamase class C family)
MQLKENGDLALEDDVNRFIDFPLRNPNYPDRSITILDLLTHKSSIADGSAYSRGYACGDPTVALNQWIRGYFESDGAYFDASENFHAWAPGERSEYNNLTFGLLAYLVEVISGLQFEQYCRTRIFEQIGMADTSWYLSGIDTSRHAVPYSYVTNGEIRGPDWGGTAQGVLGAEDGAVVPDGYAANCLYNHPNFSDGFLRTSVHQLAKYQLAYLNGGALDGKRILSESSVQEMLSPLFPDPDYPGYEQGLVWWRRELPSRDFVWEHSGSDPCINTILCFDPSSGHGVILFANTWGAELREASDVLLQEF